MGKFFIRDVALAAPLCTCVAALAPAAAIAQSVSTQAASAAVTRYAETPSAALARTMRVLATSPRDFEALIGAGRAALEMGDTHAAVGFFGRADEVHPTSPLPQAGMGAAAVADGDPASALAYFNRAQQLGATAMMIGADRGLAYDLLGRHANAQADYRAALSGRDGNEARRRLALSLAITGDKEGAIALLAPLAARGDAAAARCRALILAVSGDAEGARRLMDARMPGSGAQMAPFFRRLPALRSDQKAAAVHLGIFPDSGQPAYASARQPADRIASIDEWLRAPAQPAVAQPAAKAPVRMASAMPARRAVQPAAVRQTSKKIWLQLASGANPAALPQEFRRIRARDRELFKGINGYVAEEPQRARLLIGPFASPSDARTFAEDLESVSINAFSWTSPEGAAIRKLTE